MHIYYEFWNRSFYFNAWKTNHFECYSSANKGKQKLGNKNHTLWNSDWSRVIVCQEENKLPIRNTSVLALSARGAYSCIRSAHTRTYYTEIHSFITRCSKSTFNCSNSLYVPCKRICNSYVTKLLELSFFQLQFYIVDCWFSCVCI